MGWTARATPTPQVSLHFDTREDAIAYAEANGMAYEVEEPKPVRIKAKVLCREFPAAGPTTGPTEPRFAPVAQLDRARAF